MYDRGEVTVLCLSVLVLYQSSVSRASEFIMRSAFALTAGSGALQAPVSNALSFAATSVANSQTSGKGKATQKQGKDKVKAR